MFINLNEAQALENASNMAKKKTAPGEIPAMPYKPELNPPTDPWMPFEPPEEDPDLMPEEEPSEYPYEIPPPGE